MAINYLNSINLNKNELQNPVIHVLATAPSSPVEGQLYYNSSDSRLYFYDGSSWIDASGDIKSLTTTTSDTLSVTNENGPNPTIATVTSAVTSGGAALANGGQIYSFVTSQIATDIGNIAITVNGTSNEIEVNSGSTVNIGDGDTLTIGLPNDVTIGNDLTVTGDLTVNGTTTTVNSTTVTVDDPIFTLGGDTAPTSNDAKDKGIEFRYYDTAAKVGFIGYDESIARFVALVDATNASETFSGTDADWNLGNIYLSGKIKSYNNASPSNGEILIGSNTGELALATLTEGEGIDITNGASSITITAETASDTNAGVVELATLAEALAGTDTARAVTPAGLAARSWSGSIGDGASTSITITHNLNTRDVIIQLYDVSSYDTVYADVVRTSVDTATITFATAPGTNDIRVLVTKID